jgi:hypothetical protein
LKLLWRSPVSLGTNDVNYLAIELTRISFVTYQPRLVQSLERLSGTRLWPIFLRSIPRGAGRMRFRFCKVSRS